MLIYYIVLSLICFNFFYQLSILCSEHCFSNYSSFISAFSSFSSFTHFCSYPIDILDTAEFLAYLSAQFTTFLIISLTFSQMFYFWWSIILFRFMFSKRSLFFFAIYIYAAKSLSLKYCNYFFLSCSSIYFSSRFVLMTKYER